MKNAVRLGTTKFTLTLSTFVLLGTFGLAGCSTTVSNPPVADQTASLLDDDKDGVINARDLCTTTALGAEVNNDGCAEIVALNAMNELHILFANNSSVIPPSFNGEVRQLATFMKTFPATRVELKGYASPTGSDAHNIALSQARAASVRDALTRQGIQKSRIKIIGYGESDPVIADSASRTEILSRRVTAGVKATEESVVMEWTIYTSK
ncbi:OmpA family protein [Enterovibrio baiacu]|uniref:OmpA family protein n=1 Tax=Enterovibrio baiacu TaxID=2491023 RepID=UPI003D12D128